MEKKPCCAYDLAHDRLRFARGSWWQSATLTCAVCLAVWVRTMVKWEKR
jgi:hypothetical protein